MSNQQFIEYSAWFHALNLSERNLLLQNTQINVSKKFDVDLAQKRMALWQSQTPFLTNTYFNQRLAINEITQNEFFYLLGEPTELMQDTLEHYPNWLSKLSQAFYSHQSIELPIFTETRHQGAEGFLNIIEPLIREGKQRLNTWVQEFIQNDARSLPIELNTIEGVLFALLPRQLIGMLSRTMVLEMHVAGLQGALQGSTSDERFQSFVESLAQCNMALSILREYPVLARQLTICIEHWLEFSMEFVSRLCIDWPEIKTKLCPEVDPGSIIKIHSAGDQHRRGRSVLIVEFESGFRLVYKPRSLDVDVHFQYLLQWINERGNHAQFYTMKIISRSTYGWTEFVTRQECSSIEEIERFYERLGGYLALLKVLLAGDFHSENIIAVGEHPILVDLETLFQAYLGMENQNRLHKIANQALAYSVLSTGLLPDHLWNVERSDEIDVSGIGTTKGELTSKGLPYWENIGTDRMQLQRKRMKMTEDQNRPTLNNIEINVLDYEDKIVDGFTNMYCLLLAHRNELLSSEGPLASFYEDEVRFIARDTEVYSSILRESFHPDLLRYALDRDRFFDKLWVGIEHLPYLSKLIYAEHRDMWMNDIPIFTTKPNSCHLWDSSNERLPNIFNQPSIKEVHNQLQKMDEHDMAKQIWLIKGSIATLAIGQAHTYSQKWQYLNEAPANREQLLEAAEAIGSRLESLALRSAESVTWFGLKQLMNDKWTFAPLGVEFHDFYDDLPGIALFLAYLGLITQKKNYTKLAQAALTTMKEQMEHKKSSVKLIGGFYGWGGVIYLLTHLGVLWNQKELITDAESIVKLLPSLIDQDREWGVLSGAAGCLNSLLVLYRYRPSKHTLSAAIQCGEHLVTHAQPMKQGIGWIQKDVGHSPLAGLAYGAAGIAWSLLELAALTGQDRFYETALAAIDYERRLFSSKTGNWPDLRLSNVKHNDHNMIIAWCHGASGVGLARLRSLRHLDDLEIRTEIKTAIKTTIKNGFGYSHSLCHGDLGNLELLLQASETFNDEQLRDETYRIAAMILKSIEEHGWLCGVPLHVETPGLMTGLAGIGYGLLRLAAPERVPSVLTLEPPRL